jgi:23S rRNA pseudouridine1911/1915/1917 synthase
MLNPEQAEEIQGEGEEQELFEHYRIVVDAGQSPWRIDKFLAMRLEGISRTKIRYASDAGCIRVSDRPVKQNYLIRPGDVISILLPRPPVHFELIAEDIPLNVVYEDDDVIVIDKRAGMVVHPGFGNFSGTLLNALLFRFSGKTNAAGETIQPLLLHRIDKDTTGLLMAAKNERAQAKLSAAFFDHSIRRKYTAMVWGTPEPAEGTITGHVGRSLSNRKVMTVYPGGEHGKHAVTHYRVIESFGYVSLIECTLETGRTHQIRAHMKYAGHPLFGDITYGGDMILKGTSFGKYKQFISNCFEILSRQALHASILGFIHPSHGKEMLFTSALPEDMQTVIDKWKRYTSGREITDDAG